MQEDSSNNNAAASPVEVWDGWAQGSEPRGVEAGMAQPLARGFARKTGATLTLLMLVRRHRSGSVNRTRAGDLAWRRSPFYTIQHIRSVLLAMAATAAMTAHAIDFKQFTASPSPIEEMIVEQTWFHSTNPPSYWFIRWQTNAYVARKSETFSGSTKLFSRGDNVWFAGKYDDYFWTIQNAAKGVALREWQNQGIAEEATNWVRAAVDGIKIGSIDQILSMGAHMVPAASMQWQENGFTYLNTKGKRRITGQATYLGSGKVDSLLLTYENTEDVRQPKVQWRLDYRYNSGSNVPEGLPTEIIRNFYRPKERNFVPDDRLFIIRLVMAGQNMPKSRFEPRQFIADTNTIIPFFVSNRFEYILANGKWEPMVDAKDPNIYRPQVRRHAQATYLTFAVVFLLAPAIFLLYTARRKQPQKHDNGKKPTV